MTIADNTKRVLDQIAEAAIAAGRDPGEITLCAATKMNEADAIQQAIRAGVRCCGENRVQELTQKLPQGAYDGAAVHFIGHLQTNKVRQVVGKVELIQSVDSLHLLEAIDTEAKKQDICQKILLEVNIGAEEAKHGFAPEEMPQILEKMGNYKGISVCGLMTVAPICQDSTEIDKFFHKMYHLLVDITRKKYDNVNDTVLSMGMSGDFREAIRCGATMVRIGSAIFGPRSYGTFHQF